MCRDNQLKASESRYRRLFEAAQDGILILDAVTGQVDDVNPFLIDMLGYSHQEFIGKKLWEIGLFKDTAISYQAFLTLKKNGYIRYQDLPLETKDGRPIYVEFISNVYEVDGEKVIQCNVRDISARHKSEQLMLNSLKILDRPDEPGVQKALIHDLLLIMQELCHCEAVGIRIQKEDDYPYYKATGFIKGYFESDGGLFVRDSSGQIVRNGDGQPLLDCVCGDVLKGRFSPQKPFFTSYGSFWTNNANDYLSAAATGGHEQLSCNHCIKEGYQSIALIPLKASNTVIGLLQLSSQVRDRFNLEMIQHFENLAQSIGIVIYKIKAEEELVSSENKYRTLVNNVKVGIFRSTLGIKSKFLEINQAMEELTEYSRPELLKMDIDDLCTDPTVWQRFTRNIIRSGRTSTIELTLIRKDGSQMTAAVTDTPVRDKAGKVISLDGILEDITERKKAGDQLVEIKALKQLNISRADLLSNVSHELRTPLASIKGFIETLMEPDVKWNKKQMQEFLHSANVEVDRLAFLIQDLLTASKLDSGTMVLQKKGISLDEVLESIQAVLLRITINHQLKYELPPDLPLLFAEEIRIAQVLTNLVENACKFSPEGSQIVIAAKPVKSNVNISVKDSGIGMSKEVMDNLFNRFYQAQQKVDGKPRGTGLGLVICKGIVEAHGGKIWAESRPGKGSRFIFSIPQYLNQNP